ncbi:MAG TPA: PilZ domain-containing protein [Terriglobia bacterium]|nr:PilZ domain-containing protein [Terriglobia bacterium]
MKETSKSPERRRAPRISVSFPVLVRWGQKQFKWLAREFSEYGILLAASNKDIVGEELKLELPLDSQTTPITVEGVVAYTTETGVGIRFKNVSPDDQFALKHYVATRGIGITRK